MSTDLGTGHANTTALVDNCDQTEIAARICNSHVIVVDVYE